MGVDTNPDLDSGVVTYDVDVEDRTAWIAIDRPEKLNALTWPALDDLETALKWAETDDEIRVAVLEGTENAFSVGYDVAGDEDSDGDGDGDYDQQNADRPQTVADWLDRMGSYSIVPTIYELEIPVIAAVDGYALGGGCNIAIICDLTIATERASFGYVDVRMGGLPAHFVHPFVIGSIKHARELFYTGKTISGTEAARMGLVNRAVPHQALEEEVRAEIDAIRKTPDVVVSLTKGMLNEAMERRGFRPRGQVSEAYATLSVETEWSKRFAEIRDEDGMEAAIEWMHETDKP